MCYSNLSCLWNFIIYGITQDGGIGGIDFSVPEEDKDGFDDINIMRKQTMDLTFFILINVLLMDMVSGIIIDTFSELREETNLRGNNYFS